MIAIEPSRGCAILLTGFPGAGKSTIAQVLAETLMRDWARPAVVLDGDRFRQTVSRDLGFSRVDRLLHLGRMGLAAAEAVRDGGIVICAAIAPYHEGREAMRRQVELHGTFVVAHVATPLQVCEARDPKGLYARARAGIIGQLTGVSDPYEVPDDPDLSIDTCHLTPAAAAALIVGRLQARGCLGVTHSSQLASAASQKCQL